MNPVVVVEGVNDSRAVQRAVRLDTIETCGLAKIESRLPEMRRAALEEGLVIMTDSDAQGLRIRRILNSRIRQGTVLNAYLPIPDGAKKAFVEKAQPRDILETLEAAGVKLEADPQ